MAETGVFTSSSPLLNRLQTACQWTVRSNSMSLPTDCCQRDERRGWMGDAALGVKVNMYNHDAFTFYRNFADLMVGVLPCVEYASSLIPWPPYIVTPSPHHPPSPSARNPISPSLCPLVPLKPLATQLLIPSR